MRLWSLHPGYLDPRGLVACWREALLARKVIQGDTQGYQNHPQLHRFQSHPDPMIAIEYYLQIIYAESNYRNYCFNKNKISGIKQAVQTIPVSSGQINFEWAHLKNKLEKRNLDFYKKLKNIHREEIKPHPLFTIVPGPVASWEKSKESGSVNFI